MRAFTIALAALAAMTGAALTPGSATAQASGSAAEKACKARYDEIFANLNSRSPNKRRLSDEEISWALRYEQVVRADRPCSEADKPI